MPLIRIPNAGSVGLNKDLSAHELPINAFTDARDIRFLDGYIHQFLGHSEVYHTAQVVPYHLLPVKVADAIYWIYAGANKIYAANMAAGVVSHLNLTRQSTGIDLDYSALPNEWTSTILGGIPIMNAGNRVDPPQRWDLNLAGRFQDLENWPANTFCKSLRSYKNVLIALNIYKGDQHYPFMVKWSHPADPGGVPVSWDETNPAYDAGEFDLAEGYDHIIDGLSLRDSFMVYKESSVWRIDYVGGIFVFRSQKVLGISGAMNRNCIVDIDGYHIVLTTNDIMIHDGVNATSVLDKVTRRWLFRNIDSDTSHLCFAFKNPFFNEAYLCFPSLGADVPDSAIVFNYLDRTVSIRSMPAIYCGASGPTTRGLTDQWDSDGAPWDSDLSSWDGLDIVPDSSRVIIGSQQQRLFMLDTSAAFDGQLPHAFLERRGLSFDSPESIKLIRGIRPRITGNNGATVVIRVGSCENPYDEPVYLATMHHEIGKTVHNDCLVSGRYIAIRFETGTAYNWRMDSFDIDVEITGQE